MEWCAIPAAREDLDTFEVWVRGAIVCPLLRRAKGHGELWAPTRSLLLTTTSVHDINQDTFI